MNTQSIFEFIASCAEHAPDSVALAALDRPSLTYAELLDQVRAVGRSLHGLGVGRNEAVVVVLPHGPELVTACLGVSSFATAVPLDPESPVQLVETAFSSINPQAIIAAPRVQCAAVDVAYALGLAVIEVEPPTGAAGALGISTATSDEDTVPLPAQNGDDAFMLPTASAAGHFAAIALTHHEICSYAQDVASQLGLTDCDRCLNLTPLWKWRGSLVETVATLATGGAVVCVGDRECEFDFFKWVQECRPTWYTAEPSAHEAILSVVSSNRDVLKQSTIRFVQSSAPELSHDVQVALERVFNAPVIERANEQ